MSRILEALRSATAAHHMVAVALGAVSPQILPAQAPIDSALITLKAAIRSASPVMASRRAALDLAHARRAAAGLRAPATISAEVEEVPDVMNIAGASSMRLDVGQELLPRGRRRAERTLAQVDVERAAIELAVAEARLDVTVDQLVLRAAGNAAIAARLASEDSLLRGAEEALRARFAVADARYVDVLRLRTERLRVETEHRRAAAEYEIARRQVLHLAPALDSAELRRLIRDAVGDAIVRVTGGAMAGSPLVDSTAAMAAGRRLIALSVERAEAMRQLVRADLRPVIAPSLGIQRFSDGPGATIGLTAGVTLPLPFTSGTANRARVAVAERQVALARTTVIQTEAALAAALALAADRYAIARAQVVSYDATLLRGAREEREAALAAYRTGGLTLLELLDFERALAQAEVFRIRSQMDAMEALLEYMTTALRVVEPGDTP